MEVKAEPGRAMDEAQHNKRPPESNQRAVLSELLVLQAQQGIGEAFGKLAKLWQEPLWRHARRLTGTDDAAWDVSQESWISIGKGLGGLRDANLFRAWAYTIVTRAAATLLRRKSFSINQEFADLEQHPQPCDENDSREQVIGELRVALKKLKREDCALVSLHYLENFELWELARIYGIPEGTVKSRLHRIRHELKNLMEKKSDE
ncbi:MAG: RNA polymerase sigma factor (sigma-70 family) [Planctomycetota bacterium]|jgi:RNA polymerase sigma factor (sigma-70 family)